jgi:hypothetical protein
LFVSLASEQLYAKRTVLTEYFRRGEIRGEASREPSKAEKNKKFSEKTKKGYVTRNDYSGAERETRDDKLRCANEFDHEEFLDKDKGEDLQVSDSYPRRLQQASLFHYYDIAN